MISFFISSAFVSNGFVYWFLLSLVVFSENVLSSPAILSFTFFSDVAADDAAFSAAFLYPATTSFAFSASLAEAAAAPAEFEAACALISEAFALCLRLRCFFFLLSWPLL